MLVHIYTYIHIPYLEKFYLLVVSLIFSAGSWKNAVVGRSNWSIWLKIGLLGRQKQRVGEPVPGNKCITTRSCPNPGNQWALWRLKTVIYRLCTHLWTRFRHAPLKKKNLSSWHMLLLQHGPDKRKIVKNGGTTGGSWDGTSSSAKIFGVQDICARLLTEAAKNLLAENKKC